MRLRSWARLGLDQHLSAQRSNGLRAMVGRIRAIAESTLRTGLTRTGAPPCPSRSQTLLAERDWLLADGATGTNLFNMGLEAGEAPELWNETEPGKIRALYEGAVDAGSDIFLTNSFGGNASRLKLHDADGPGASSSTASPPRSRREVADARRAARWWSRARWGRPARSWRRWGR